MLSNKYKNIIVKGLTGTTIFSTISLVTIPVTVNATTSNPSEISKNIEDTKSIFEPFIQFGNSIISCGKEFINAMETYENVEYVKFHFLPTKGKANSTMQLICPNTGKLIQTRIYDENGNAMLDIDYTPHGDGAFTDSIHKHVWKNGVRLINQKLTKEEYIRYNVVPRGYVESTTKTRFKPLYNTEKHVGVQISYNDFILALKQNSDIKFKVGDTVFNWSYSRDKYGNGKYKLIYRRPFLGVDILEYKTYNSRRNLLEFKLYDHTFEEIWDHVTILSIN